MTEVNLATPIRYYPQDSNTQPSVDLDVDLDVDFDRKDRNARSVLLTDQERALHRIDSRINLYCDQISNHPVADLLSTGGVPVSVLYECALTQYKGSILWVPLLSLIKDRVRNERLKKAVLDNLLCESGARGVSHVELCSRFLSSVRSHHDDLNSASNLVSALDVNLSELVFVASLSEPELTGWLLAAETLTPSTDKVLLEGFKRIHGIDLAFLREHIVVDSDEHAVWMREAASELLQDPCNLRLVISGIDLGARAELKLLDLIYSRTLINSKMYQV